MKFLRPERQTFRIKKGLMQGFPCIYLKHVLLDTRNRLRPFPKLSLSEQCLYGFWPHPAVARPYEFLLLAQIMRFRWISESGCTLEPAQNPGFFNTKNQLEPFSKLSEQCLCSFWPRSFLNVEIFGANNGISFNIKVMRAYTWNISFLTPGIN